MKTRRFVGRKTVFFFQENEELVMLRLRFLLKKRRVFSVGDFPALWKTPFCSKIASKHGKFLIE